MSPVWVTVRSLAGDAAVVVKSGTEWNVLRLKQGLSDLVGCLE